MTKNLIYDQALSLLENGNTVTKNEWRARGMFLYLAEGSKTIELKNAEGTIDADWKPTEEDLIAQDWEMINSL
jgi:hypothetical protein